MYPNLSNTPLVSIACITYNHEEYIRDAIEGFLMQKTTFPIEIIIHDDASTDGTAQIIKEYEIKYPDLFFPIYQKENQYSKVTNRILATFVFPKARGKYIALCEGDDYWTDPLKLQKQVDFLEQNPEFAICCHAVNFEYEDGRPSFIRRKHDPGRNRYTLRDLCIKNRFSTASTFYRNHLFDGFPSWYYQMPTGDWPLHILNAEHGDIWYMDEIMATYRVHKGGYWSGMDIIELKKKEIYGFLTINSYLKNRYEKEIMGTVWHHWLDISELYEARGEIQEARAYSWKCVSNLHAGGTYPIIMLIKNLIKVYFPGIARIYRGLKWSTQPQ